MPVAHSLHWIFLFSAQQPCLRIHVWSPQCDPQDRPV